MRSYGRAKRRVKDFPSFAVTRFVVATTILLVTALAGQSRGPGAFRNAVVQAGLRFTHQSSPTPEKFLPETMGSGCAFIDIDNDGWLDIVLLNGGWMPGTSRDRDFSHALFRNRADGTFTDLSARSGLAPNPYFGMGAAVGDYDGDGFDDIFITNFNGPNQLYRNKGDGTFVNVTQSTGVAGEGKWSASAAFLDFDNDSHLDLFVTRYVDFTFENNKICGPFAEKGIRAYCTPQVYDPLSNLLYRNNGDGSFTDVSSKSGIAAVKGKGLGVSLLDFNADGFTDIYVANDSVANFLFRNNGDGSFKEVGFESGVALDENGQPQAGMGTVSGDFDGDGRPDIFVTNLDFEYLNVYRNLGGGIFEDASARTGVQLASRAFVGFGLGLLDFDNDGDLDLFVGNGHILDNAPLIRQGATYLQRKLLFENNNGVFKDVAEARGGDLRKPESSRGLAVGDYNNDGRLDVLVANRGGSPSLFENTTLPGPWIRVALRGQAANRRGIGARIEVSRGAAKPMVREVFAAGSYLSSNDARAHFGLGKSAAPVDIRVAWPSGKVQRRSGVSVNQTVTIEEP